MCGYHPISKDDLSAFGESNVLAITRIFVPSEKLAREYGVADLEESEYGALEIARDKMGAAIEARVQPRAA